MAGTTTNYSFPYPDSTDDVSAGATKIQELAQKLEDFFDNAAGSSAFIGLGGASDLTVSTAYSRAMTAGAAFVTLNSPSALTYTFTPRASGLFMLTFSGNGKSSAATNWWISPDISGGATLASGQARSIAGNGTSNQSGSCVYLVDGTANTAITVAIQGKSTSASTVTLNDHMMQVVYLG
jgi:hypothetical protein